MVRWLVASLVTIAAFAMATSICGALILPTVMKDPGVRWGVAGALGVAVAALAALWGHSFATAERSTDAAHTTSAPAPTTTITGPGTTSNKISGTFHQPVIQARDIYRPASDGSIPPQTTDSGQQDCTVAGKSGTRNEISGGIFFSAVIQGSDITLQLPREITPALSGLPLGTPAFTGRDTDLR